MGAARYAIASKSQGQESASILQRNHRKTLKKGIKQVISVSRNPGIQRKASYPGAGRRRCGSDIYLGGETQTGSFLLRKM